MRREIRVALIAEAEQANGTSQNSARTVNNIQIIGVPPAGHVIDQYGQLLRQTDEVLRTSPDAH
jgi:hypothetical protein